MGTRWAAGSRLGGQRGVNGSFNHQPSSNWALSGVGAADRRRIVQALPGWPERRNEVAGIGGLKLHDFLALQEVGIGYARAAKQRLVAVHRFGAEIHDNGRRSRAICETHPIHRYRYRAEFFESEILLTGG